MKTAEPKKSYAALLVTKTAAGHKSSSKEKHQQTSPEQWKRPGLTERNLGGSRSMTGTRGLLWG